MNVPGFVEEKLLGKGSYGRVYKAKRLADGQSYAVKVIHLSDLNQREIIDSVNEIRLMASLTSPYIITFYQAFYDNKRLCIVSEYSKLGDLAHLIERRKRAKRPFKEDDIWRYLVQILEGLKILHNANVVHRDIKSANILISAPDLIKIADLGISTVLYNYPNHLARTQIGTPYYIAPEIWKKRQYDSKCDIWMTFTFPFLGRNDQELTHRVCLGYYITPKGYSSDLVYVLRRLLQVNPQNRPSVNEILNFKCIKDRVHLINKSIISGYDAELKRDTIRRMIQPSPSDGCLLSTIKITRNLKNLNFPQPMYGKRVNIIRPLEQRMHLKQGVPVKKDIREISSPTLKEICDKDWWSPNKLTPLRSYKSQPQIDLQEQIFQLPNEENVVHHHYRLLGQRELPKREEVVKQYRNQNFGEAENQKKEEAVKQHHNKNSGETENQKKEEAAKQHHNQNSSETENQKKEEAVKQHRSYSSINTNNKKKEEVVEQYQNQNSNDTGSSQGSEENKQHQDQNSQQAEKQKHHPHLPKRKQIHAHRPIYKINNENISDNAIKDNDSDKNSKGSGSSISPSSSSSYKSDSSSDPQSTNENCQKKLISIGNGKIKVPAGKKVRHGNPRVRKYRVHRSEME